MTYRIEIPENSDKTNKLRQLRQLAITLKTDLFPLTEPSRAAPLARRRSTIFSCTLIGGRIPAK